MNIMMDGYDLFPYGFHPSRRDMIPSCENFARPRKRIDVESVRYYFIDFGISSYYEDLSSPPEAIGAACQDHDVPELSEYRTYDPFKVDIFTLGNQYKKSFLDVRNPGWP